MKDPHSFEEALWLTGKGWHHGFEAASRLGDGLTIAVISWSQDSRIGMSRPGIRLSYRIFKSRLVLVLVSNGFYGLAELRYLARLLVLVSKLKAWPVNIRYWSWY